MSNDRLTRREKLTYRFAPLCIIVAALIADLVVFHGNLESMH